MTGTPEQRGTEGASAWVTPRRAGPWIWQNWHFPGEHLYVTETPRADNGGWYHWTCVREGRSWWLMCDSAGFDPVECPTLTYASEVVETANGGPQ